MSDYLRDLPFLWINVDDEPNADSQRAYIERNSISLLSNYQRDAVDARLEEWLGNQSRSEKIRESGLWNVNHVDEAYQRAFLDELSTAIADTEPV